MIFIQCVSHNINRCGRRIVVSWLYLKWRITPTDETAVYPHLAIWTPHRTCRSAPTVSYNSWLNCNYMRKHVWHLVALSWYIQLLQCFIPSWVFEMNTSQALHILKNPNIRQSSSHAAWVTLLVGFSDKNIMVPETWTHIKPAIPHIASWLYGSKTIVETKPTVNCWWSAQL